MGRRREYAALAAVAVLGVTGCSGDGAPQSGPTVPLETFQVDPPGPSVVRTEDGDGLLVTTSGTSSCPTGPAKVTLTGPQELQIDVDFLFPGREVCSADLNPTTTEVDVPADISADEPLTVRLGDADPVVLPPAGN